MDSNAPLTEEELAELEALTKKMQGKEIVIEPAFVPFDEKYANYGGKWKCIKGINDSELKDYADAVVIIFFFAFFFGGLGTQKHKNTHIKKKCKEMQFRRLTNSQSRNQY